MYVEIEDKRIIIDLGVTMKRLTGALSTNGRSFDKLDAILITHAHNDHVKGMEICLKKLSAPIYMSESTKNTLCCENAKILPYRKKTQIAEGLWVTGFRTSHDCPGSMGFVIETERTKLGYATDLGEITDDILNVLTGAECIVLEANHDEEMLRFGPYPMILKKRILSNHGHLSNECCAEAAAVLAERGTKHFLLAHLSRENNTPKTALATVESALGGSAEAEILPQYGDYLLTIG